MTLTATGSPVIETPASRAQGQRRARVIAFYLPQFHPIPENDEWWGTGFTEWTNVARARSLFPGHVQPRLPTELGYYDLRVPETRAHQAALAEQHGIEGFCYWHYWFEGRRILERPFAEVLASGQPNFPFCLAWANQTWTGIWHGAPERILIQQTYGDRADVRRHFDAVLPAFRDPRYLCVDGRPIFVVHQPEDLPEPRTFTSLWREWARAEGLPEIFFLGAELAGWMPHDYGFDGTLIANPWSLLNDRPRPWFDRLLSLVLREQRTTLAQHVLGWPARIPYKDVVRYAVPRDQCPFIFPSVLPNWDNTPRSAGGGLVITRSSPELFRQHLDDAFTYVGSRPCEHRLVFLKSWNEWAEGNFVEPDEIHGRAYLTTLRQAQCG